MDKNAYSLEEYKYIAGASLEIDKRILQIFAVATAVSISLLSAVASLILGKQQGQITAVLAYAALAPDILVVPAFYLMLSQRLDMIRLGSHRRIFFEERNEIEGWETQLEKFRKLEKTEANDPIPYTYWTLFLASVALFVYRIIEARASLCHLFILALPLMFLGWAHYRWKQVIPTEMPRHVNLWRQVSGSISTLTQQRKPESD